MGREGRETGGKGRKGRGLRTSSPASSMACAPNALASLYAALVATSWIALRWANWAVAMAYAFESGRAKDWCRLVAKAMQLPGREKTKRKVKGLGCQRVLLPPSPGTRRAGGKKAGSTHSSDDGFRLLCSKFDHASPSGPRSLAIVSRSLNTLGLMASSGKSWKNRSRKSSSTYVMSRVDFLRTGLSGSGGWVSAAACQTGTEPTPTDVRR